MNKQKIKELLCLLVDEYYELAEIRHNNSPVIEEVIGEVNSDLEVNDSPVIEEPDDKMNLGYYTYWNKTGKDLSRYTHITYAFLDIEDNGNPNSTEIDTIQIDFDGMKGISIGGSVGSNKVMRILQDNRKRKRFIERVLTSMSNSGFDYINYDLEYPTKDLIEKVLSETKEYILDNNLDIKISVCLACWRGFVAPYENCNEYIDWVELMVYDDKKIIYFCKQALELLKSYGYPDNKIIIGDSLDKNGIPDTPETIQYKESIKHKYGGKFLWEVSMYEGKEEEEEKGEVINNEQVFKDKWDNPYREMKKARELDIYDNRTYFRGNGKVSIEKGIMTLSGSQPRLYVYTLNIQDVEAQVDFMRVGNSGVGWSGGNIGVRSDVEGHGLHHHLAHTYYFRLKHGQQLDFYKEEEHGNGKATGVIKTRKFEWEKGIWYRMMFRCYNLSNNQVKLEGYINGKLELEHIDTDKRMYDARGIVFIRNTSIDEAKYKNFSIKQYKRV